MGGKVTITTLLEKKKLKKPITMLTAYDFSLAKAVDLSGVDCILVGDSLGNVVLGYEHTLQVTMEDMLHHVQAVARGAKRAMIVADMPFLSCHLTTAESIRNAGSLIQAGAHAVKIEGGGAQVTGTVEAIVEAGIPVMGHIGLTPQRVLQLGGYKVQGKEEAEAGLLFQEAKSLEAAGAFAVVLECIPARLAERITTGIGIPTIGIGAGPYCDGQVLVTYDLLGINDTPTPKFVKKYADLHAAVQEALQTFVAEVNEGIFPDLEHSYTGQKEKICKLY
ncbi:3-methyl-2-oxobutanoate hydroxymethyltransferase [Zhaonella formicivorans]|uniref:3-methyl-2-oxobutanoate hydroxymethyltransferase n=1 Tax=Zhaonella formicivorans TaxID=2528593 RepID=UPI0010D63A50|nr:3-methyl-2-oxobutanoate hydroxymethyltransferase [Zhaonella formicivorans]